MPTTLSLPSMTGMHLEADPAEIPETACTACENVTFDKGTIKTRAGRVRHSAVPGDGLTAGIRGLFPTASGVDDPQVRLLATIGDRIYATHTDDQQFTSFLRLNTTVRADHPVRFAQFNDAVFFVDGTPGAKVKRVLCTEHDGAVLTVHDVRKPPALTFEPHISQDYADYRLIWCDVGSTTGKGCGFQYRSPKGWADEQDFPTGLCAYRAGSIAIGEVSGATVRKFTDPANCYPGRAANIGLEIVSVGPGDIISGDIRWFANVADEKRKDGFDLSEASRVTIRWKVVSGTNNPMPQSMKLCFSEDKESWQEVDIETVGMPANTWNISVVNIAGIEIAKRDTVRYVGIHISALEVNPTARLEKDATVFLPEENNGITILLDGIEVDITEPTLAQGRYEYTYTYIDTATGEESSPYIKPKSTMGDLYPVYPLNDPGCTKLTFTVGLDAPTLANISALNIYLRGGLSATWLQLTSLPILEGVLSYSFTWDGQYSGQELVLTDEYSVSPPEGCSLLFADKGRMIYVGSYPEAGIGSGFHDTLFVSNLMEPGRVILQPLADMSTKYGFYQTIGQDGAAITGLGALGGNVVIFKQRGVYLFSGTDSNSFRIDQVSTEHGCVSHESIQQVEGGQLIWLDLDRIWSWDGQAFTDLGEPITPLLAGYTPAQKQHAFSVYDPAKRRLILTFPAVGSLVPAQAGTLTTGSPLVSGLTSTSGMCAGMSVQGAGLPAGCTLASVDSDTQITLSASATTTGASTLTFQLVEPAAESLVYDLKDGSWTKWTQQPGGCAVYAPLAATPGIYAGDGYGADGAGYLYRLNTGTADATSTAASVPIPWSWRSKHFAEPFPGYEKDVQEVIADIGAHGPGDTLTLSLHPEGCATPQASATLPIADALNGRGTVGWWPGPLLGATTVQLGIAGSTAQGCEVRTLTLTVARGARNR